MCGIAGIISKKYDPNELQAYCYKMTEAQRHRGPDDHGINMIMSNDPTVVFGHTRLAIIDLSSKGRQPMHDQQTGNWIVFNGEIYNFKQLRIELEATGQNFLTKTDTEVILKAYNVWGNDFLKKLRGIFAFAIWNHKKKVLFLCRDPLGVKPLYYWQNNSIIIFASEVRALLTCSFVPQDLNYKGLKSYLAYGSVQDPYTLIDGVESLLPGHFLIWNNGVSKKYRYWKLPSQEQILKHPPENVLVQTAQCLRNAVGSQMISDVPIGAFLSGGIDSVAIAALMQCANKGHVKTFSIVFNEKEYDERTFSRLAAQYIGTDHTELELRAEMVRDNLSKALAAFDQPSLDGLNTYFVSKVVKEAGLTVALSGVGGDELFGGYDGYKKSLLVEHWNNRIKIIPHFLRKKLSKLLYGLDNSERIRKIAALLNMQNHPYFVSRRLFSEVQIQGLLNKNIPDILSWEPETFKCIEEETKEYDPINRASAFELQTYMLSTLLRDTDQMSMAHALEVRVPLIDHLLVEFIFTLPGYCKLDAKYPKPLLTRSLETAIPHDCVFRPKRGFELPFAAWFHEGLDKEMTENFSDSGKNSIWPFEQKTITNIWQQFKQGYVSWSRVWAIFVLRNWLKQQGIS